MSTQIDQVEKTLTELITAHGADRVRQDLNALLPRGRWADWQQLVNITQNIERRQLRERKGKQQ